MSKGRWAFRPGELKRAIKTAESAGKEVARAEIDSMTGKIVLVFAKSGASVADTVNEWDGVE
jgi:hypothetical protein